MIILREQLLIYLWIECVERFKISHSMIILLLLFVHGRVLWIGVNRATPRYIDGYAWMIIGIWRHLCGLWLTDTGIYWLFRLSDMTILLISVDWIEGQRNILMSTNVWFQSHTTVHLSYDAYHICVHHICVHSQRYCFCHYKLGLWEQLLNKHMVT